MVWWPSPHLAVVGAGHSKLADDHSHHPKAKRCRLMVKLSGPPGCFSRSWLRLNILLGSLPLAAFGTL